MTPTQFLKNLEGNRKKDITTLHKMIKKIAPKLKPFVMGSMNSMILGYGKYKYKTKSGCEGDFFQIGISNRKNYISLYVPCTEGGKYIAEKYKKKLPKANIGKSCIRFKKLNDLDIKIVEEVLKKAAKLKPIGMK